MEYPSNLENWGSSLWVVGGGWKVGSFSCMLRGDREGRVGGWRCDSFTEWRKEGEEEGEGGQYIRHPEKPKNLKSLPRCESLCHPDTTSLYLCIATLLHYHVLCEWVMSWNVTRKMQGRVLESWGWQESGRESKSIGVKAVPFMKHGPLPAS